MSARTNQAAELAAEAMGLPDDLRQTLLDRACAGDAALLQEVHQLLALGPGLMDFLALAPGTEALASQGHRRSGFFGRYRVLRLIGEGGMGCVYEAEQDHPRRSVALKVIKLGMDTRQVIARFEVEREALGMMDHPNVAKVYDAGSTDTGRPFFSMELVRGVPLTEYCDANHLSVRERLELFEQVCRAVHHAHQKGIIHRDLKPSNILVTLVDGRPVPKVIDFGIAKATHRKLTDATLVTEFRQLVGTPEYMSPEQAEMTGIDIDTRSDVYSLGVLLYELLTGTTPFTASELREAGYDEVRRVIRDVEPPPPSTRLSRLAHQPGPSVPDGGGAGSSPVDLGERVARSRRTDARTLYRTLRRDLDWVVMKALEKDRTRRYDTAAALAEDIERFLTDKPVLAAPPGVRYRLAKFLRRNRQVVRTVAVVCAALLIGLVGMAFGLARANAERERAAAAEPLLLDAYTRLKADRAASLEDRRSAVRNLVTLYQRWGKPDKVSQWKRELEVLAAEDYARLATEHGSRGEFAQAAADYDEALRRDPDNQWWWYQSACLRAQLGDAAEYQRHCRELLRRFSRDPNPMIGERTAKACLLRPNSGVDLDVLTSMVDQSLLTSEGHPLRGWFELAKGIVEYRSNRPKSAEAWLQRSLGGNMAPEGNGTALVLLAAVRKTQGDDAEAAEALRKGVALVDEAFVESKTKPPGAEWHNWIVYDLFRREAQALLEGKTPATAPVGGGK